MTKIIPLFAADQGLVDRLCDLVRAIINDRELTDSQQEFLDRILKDEEAE